MMLHGQRALVRAAKSRRGFEAARGLSVLAFTATRHSGVLHAGASSCSTSAALPDLLIHMPSRDRRERQQRSSVATRSLASLAAVAEVVLSFTPQHALLGGLVLGAATLTKLITTGRILGISGGIKGLVQGEHAPWRWAFNGGLLAGAALLAAYMPSTLEALPASFPMWRAALAGLLVGYGAAIGNGCTSGHGICGNARLSPRSMVYTATFMAAGAASATLTNTLAALHVATASSPVFQALSGADLTQAGIIVASSAALLGVATLADRVAASSAAASASAAAAAAAAASGAGTAAAPTACDVAQHKAANFTGLEVATEAAIGLAFALGLGLSGMTSAAKVAGWLSPLSGAWDLSLPFVMGGAVAVAMIGFQGIVGPRKLMSKPLVCERFALPTNNTIDAKLVTGGVLFGAGWGLAGMCPGPAIVNVFGAFTPQLGAYLGCLALGMALEKVPLTPLFGQAKGPGAVAH